MSPRADGTRSAPPLTGDERATLEGWLDFHRTTLVLKCDGLTPVQLATRSVPPSTLSLLGLVRHMADVEQHWFERIFLGRSVTPRYWSGEQADADFEFGDPTAVTGADVAEALAALLSTCAVSRQAVGDVASLDQRAARRHRGHDEDVSLRWILVHMIEEYARHNGHADLLRQRLDGATGT